MFSRNPWCMRDQMLPGWNQSRYLPSPVDRAGSPSSITAQHWQQNSLVIPWINDLVPCVTSLHFWFAPSQRAVFLLVIPYFALQHRVQILCQEQVSLIPFMTRSLMLVLIEISFYHPVFSTLFVHLCFLFSCYCVKRKNFQFGSTEPFNWTFLCGPSC